MYLSQLIESTGRYWECQPAYHVVATMSSLETFPELPYGIEGFDVPPAAEGVDEAATEDCDGLSEHMGAAHAGTKFKARSEMGNTYNMLACKGGDSSTS